MQKEEQANNRIRSILQEQDEQLEKRRLKSKRVLIKNKSTTISYTSIQSSNDPESETIDFPLRRSLFLNDENNYSE